MACVLLLSVVVQVYSPLNPNLFSFVQVNRLLWAIQEVTIKACEFDSQGIQAMIAWRAADKNYKSILFSKQWRNGSNCQLEAIQVHPSFTSGTFGKKTKGFSNSFVNRTQWHNRQFWETSHDDLIAVFIFVCWNSMNNVVWKGVVFIASLIVRHLHSVLTLHLSLFAFKAQKIMPVLQAI